METESAKLFPAPCAPHLAPHTPHLAPHTPHHAPPHTPHPAPATVLLLVMLLFHSFCGVDHRVIVVTRLVDLRNKFVTLVATVHHVFVST